MESGEVLNGERGRGKYEVAGKFLREDKGVEVGGECTVIDDRP